MSIKTRLYCCGGTGVNIGRLTDSDWFTRAFIDASQSNRTEGLPGEDCYFIEGLDGSGGRRQENHPIIAAEIPAILETHPPGDFNVVLFSAGGGSGSVIGHLMMRDLLNQGQTAVAVVVGAEDSDIRVGNTIATLKSLELVSLRASQPIVMAYHQNTPGVPRGEIDSEVLYVLEALSVLTNQDNHGLDTMDLTNWVQYQKVSSLQPQLSALMVFDHRSQASQVIEPLSIASLYTDPDDANPFGNPHYATDGFPRSQSLPNESNQLHFVINTAEIEEFFKHLEERKAALGRAYNSQRQRRALIDVDDNATDDDLIL